MNILISNDDSLYAEGLAALVKYLSPNHHLYIAAPRFEQSAKSHALTMHDIVPAFKETLYKEENVIEQWAIAGTPADCVKIGIEKFKEVTIDVMLSGINRGPNMGVDTIYSGTVAAAIESSFHGLPSIALSLFNPTDEGFEASAKFVAENLETLVANHQWDGNVLNINFPDPPFKGVKITKLGEISYENPVQKRMSPRGAEYYWIAGDLKIPKDQEGTDVECVMDGYVSLSPIKFQFDDLLGTAIEPSQLKV